MTIRLTFLLAGLLFLPLAGAVPPQPEPAPRTVLIGFAGALSGVSESVGKSLANAADMALAEVNRQNPRIAGQRVFFSLLRKDDRNDPQTAPLVARQLLDAGVVAVIGTANSGTTQAVGRLYADAGVPLVTPAASATALAEQGFSTFFRMVGDDGDAAAQLARFAVGQQQMTRFAVIDNGTMFGTGVADSFAAQVQKQGGQVVAREQVGFVSDLRQLVLRMGRQDVQVLFFGGYSAQSVELAQLIRQEHVDMRLMLASSGAVGSHFLIAARTAANGVVAIESGPPPSKMAGWRQFETEYNARYGLNSFGLAPFAYDAAQVLVAAMRQADSWKSGKIADALRTISFKGLTGTIAFDARGNPRQPVFTVYRVEDQKWVPLRIYDQY